jgi:hypothetical protein
MNASPNLKHMSTPFIQNLHRFLINDPQHADVCALASILGVSLDDVPQGEPAAATSSVEAVESVKLVVSPLPPGHPIVPSTASAARDHDMGIATLDHEMGIDTLAGLQLADGPTLEHDVEVTKTANKSKAAYADSAYTPAAEDWLKLEFGAPANVVVVHASQTAYEDSKKRKREAAVAAGTGLSGEPVNTIERRPGTEQAHLDAKRVQEEFAGGHTDGRCLFAEALAMQTDHEGRLAKAEQADAALTAEGKSIKNATKAFNLKNNHQKMINRVKAFYKAVTGKEASECKDFTWLDEEANIVEYLEARRIEGKSYGTLAKNAEDVQRLYVFYAAYTGGDSFRWERYKQNSAIFKDLDTQSRNKLSQEDKANLPTYEQVIGKIQSCTGEHKVQLCLYQQFICRTQNYIIHCFNRDKNGQLWHWPNAGDPDAVEYAGEVLADGFPSQTNAMVRNTIDGQNAYRYSQCVYKESERYGRKIARCNQRLTEALDQLGLDGRQSLLTRADGKAADENRIRDMLKETFKPDGIAPTPRLLRTAFALSPEQRESASVINGGAFAMNHSTPMHLSGSYCAKDAS